MNRTRFAPSPTGYVHIGSLRTALFSFLLARHSGGVNILRIEDTDQNRLVQGALENLVEVLHKLGVEFDEGYFWDMASKSVKERGEFGPYLQSRRLDIYQPYVKQLIGSGHAYYCYCSSERLDELRKEQTALKKPPMYDRKCRNLTDDERKKLLKECLDDGRKPVVRMAVPLEGSTVVHDLIYGDVVYDNKILDDQIILKSDGFPTYHLAVVVDDHLMQITHVIRGEEWIPSTPKHLLLYQFLNWEPTKFAHLPLILNTDKTKLSKRKGDVSVEGYLNKGYLPDALVNFVALLGWNPKTEQEIFSMEDLVREFDLSKVNKSGAVFDVNKLDWMNGKYIRAIDDAALAEKLVPYWEKEGWLKSISNFKFQISNNPVPSPLRGGLGRGAYEQEKEEYNLPLLNTATNFSYLVAITKVEKDRLKKLSDIVQGTKFYFVRPEYDPQLLAWKKSTLEDAKAKLAELGAFFEQLTDSDFERDNIEAKVLEFIKSRGYDNGSVLWPLRVAVTGLEKSSGPFDAASVLAKGLGREEIKQRLQVVI